jgi:hypothetical protein
MAVSIVLLVRLVVLVVVAVKVCERETIVSGDEIDTGPRSPAPLVEQVGRPE